MSKTIKKLVSIVMIAAFVLVNFTGLLQIDPKPEFVAKAAAATSTTSNIFYIQNSYTQGAYLYEDNGVLRYGIPVKGDKSFEWVVESNGSNKTIKNLATNHYITLQGHSTSANSYTDPVSCTAWQNNNDAYLWKFDLPTTTTGTANILSASKTYTGFVLHLEGVTNGQTAAQKIAGDQLTWGNMLWYFLKESDVNFDAMARDGFCIQNSQTGTLFAGQQRHSCVWNPDRS